MRPEGTHVQLFAFNILAVLNRCLSHTSNDIDVGKKTYGPELSILKTYFMSRGFDDWVLASWKDFIDILV